MRSEKERLVIDRIKKGYGLTPISDNKHDEEVINILESLIKEFSRVEHYPIRSALRYAIGCIVERSE